MAQGPRVKGKTAVRRVPLNLKVPPEMRATLEDAADHSGRSLAAEVEFRVHEYESLRRLVDELLDDSVAIKLGVMLASLRNAARAGGADTDPTNASLKRAIITATCIANLFHTVAEHAAEIYADHERPRLKERWQQRIDLGDLKGGFDLDEMASVISEHQVVSAKDKGADLARQASVTAGSAVWDICFEKDDLQRSSNHAFGGGLMANFALPPEFLPLPQAEDERLTFIEKSKTTGLMRAAASKLMSEDRYSGMTEEEVAEALYRELLEPPDYVLAERGTDGASNET